jgi:hypothetical protein
MIDPPPWLGAARKVSTRKPRQMISKLTEIAAALARGAKNCREIDQKLPRFLLCSGALVAGLGTLDYVCEDRYAGDGAPAFGHRSGAWQKAILLINGEFRAEATLSSQAST